jgi:hypothetical protein
MAELTTLTIEPLTRTVTVRGTAVTVEGVDLADAVMLAFRFPALATALRTRTIDATTLAASSELAAAVIAAGCRQIDEENAARLALAEKAELLAAVLELTMPSGPAALLATINKLLGAVIGGKPKRAKG